MSYNQNMTKAYFILERSNTMKTTNANKQPNKIHTRFFDFEIGDKIVIKNNICPEQFLPILVNDIQKAGLDPLVLFTKQKDYYPCRCIYWKNEDRKMLFCDLLPIINGAELFIIDHLFENDDVENTLRLIDETKELKNKTIIILCDVSHWLKRPDGVMNEIFKPTQKQIQDEKDFKDMCLRHHFNAIYHFYGYSRFFAKGANLINTLNPDKGTFIPLYTNDDLINKKFEDK